MMNEIDPHEFAHLREEVAGLRSDIQGLLDAWRTATGVVRFIKLLGGVGTAVAALWALIQLGSHK